MKEKPFISCTTSYGFPHKVHDYHVVCQMTYSRVSQDMTLNLFILGVFRQHRNCHAMSMININALHLNPRNSIKLSNVFGVYSFVVFQIKIDRCIN